MATKLSVVIPAYNEEAAIADVLTELQETLKKADIDAEIVVVDDGSPDKTGAEAHRVGARVLRWRRSTRRNVPSVKRRNARKIAGLLKPSASV